MNTNWNYQDIIDLEYLLLLDGDSSNEELKKRDREIFLALVDYGGETAQGVETDNAPALVKQWLDARRKQSAPSTVLPGSYAAEAHALLRIALILLGLFSGGAAGLAFLAYSGSTPVNVLNFLVLFVFSQLLMTLLLLSRGAFGKLGVKSAGLSRSLSFRLVATAVARLGGWLLRRSELELDGQKRLAMQAVLGRTRAAGTVYAGIFSWPLFLVIQLFGICFNLGLLATTLLKITVSDVAFGWQSTLQFSSQSLHQFVSWLALPWSWLIAPPSGHPGLHEIEGSRIILKEGIEHLQTPDLVSWWPFLLLCVLVYGLLTRILFYGWGKYAANRAQQKLKFDTPALRQVVRRMQTPLVTTQATPEPAATTRLAEPPPEEGEPARPEQYALRPLSLLLPEELHEACDTVQLQALLRLEGFDIADTYCFMADYEADQQLVARFSRKNWQESAGITIIQEAWMPPLVSFLCYLKEIRNAVGTLPIMIRLTGKPDGKSLFTPVADELNLKVWQQKIDSLGDPYLEVRPLIER